MKVNKALAKWGTAVIVTGRGSHSEHGQARIKPAVMELLDELGLQYKSIANGGALEVVRRV